MTDSRVRELERRWKEIGGSDDEAALLRERVRVGELSSSKLELAAWLGHPAARQLTPPWFALERDDGFSMLNKWSKETRVRIAVALGRVALRSGDKFALRAAGLSAIQAAEAWVRCPCKQHLAAARGATHGGGRSVDVITNCAAEACQAPTSSARRALKFSMNLPNVEREDGEWASSMCEILSAEVVPWVLGYGDPIREPKGPELDVESLPVPTPSPNLSPAEMIERMEEAAARELAAQGPDEPLPPEELMARVAALDSKDQRARWKAQADLQGLGEDVVAPFAEFYPRARTWQGRTALVVFSTRYARTHEDAYQLGCQALGDRSRVVRYRACQLLAYSLRREALPLLSKLLTHKVSHTREDAAAAIDAIENQNHHLFIDRDHSGSCYWSPKSL